MTLGVQARPEPRHMLSFLQVTREQAARGVQAICVRCGAEVRDLEAWFAERCPGKEGA